MSSASHGVRRISFCGRHQPIHPEARACTREPAQARPSCPQDRRPENAKDAAINGPGLALRHLPSQPLLRVQAPIPKSKNLRKTHFHARSGLHRRPKALTPKPRGSGSESFAHWRYLFNTNRFASLIVKKASLVEEIKKHRRAY